MTFSSKEKNIIRLLISARPTPEYMIALSSDDKFARAEMAEFMARKTEECNDNLKIIEQRRKEAQDIMDLFGSKD